MPQESTVIEDFLKEIRRLREAERLLRELYLEIRPYQNGTISNATWNEVCRFYKFDDSE